MKTSKKTINNHFIQKAFAKNFSNKGILKYTIYKPNSKIVNDEIFDVNEINTGQHPIVKQKFHSQEVENGMNEIESDGIKAIKKIACESNNNIIDNKITLNQNELYALQFYFLLTDIRTDRDRNNISNLNGDFLFNKVIKEDKRSAKDIQEIQIQIVIDEYKRYKKKETLLSTKLISECLKSKENILFFWKDLTIEKSLMIIIQNIINSRLIIFKFKKNKLFLQEKNSFNELNKYGANLYNFMAICPNVGIMFYMDPLITRGLLKLEESVIFKNKISDKINKTIYVGDDVKYIYDVLEEGEEVQDICNAMTLVHNKDGFLSYQNKDDIKDAEIQIKKHNIYRVEETR